MEWWLKSSAPCMLVWWILCWITSFSNFPVLNICQTKFTTKWPSPKQQNEKEQLQHKDPRGPKICSVLFLSTEIAGSHWQFDLFIYFLAISPFCIMFFDENLPTSYLLSSPFFSHQIPLFSQVFFLHCSWSWSLSKVTWLMCKLFSYGLEIWCYH